jgi:hypothetical protein
MVPPREPKQSLFKSIFCCFFLFASSQQKSVSSKAVVPTVDAHSTDHLIRVDLFRLQLQLQLLS